MIDSENRKKIPLQEQNLLHLMPLFSWLPWKNKFQCPSLKNLSCGGGRQIVFMVWHHGIYYRERVHFLDVQVVLKNNEISADLYVKETDSHQYFHPSSCHTCHCIKSIPNSQALRLNRICPSNIFYANRCYQLEKWLSDRSYKQKLVKNKFLRQELYLRRHCLIMKEIFSLRIGWHLI